MGSGAVAAGAPAATPAAGAAPSAADASATLGIFSVVPATTGEVSDRPLAAANERVVKLLAAAIDHRVSPGWTTCGTAAAAGGAAAAADGSEARRNRSRPRSPPPGGGRNDR